MAKTPRPRPRVALSVRDTALLHRVRELLEKAQFDVDVSTPEALTDLDDSVDVVVADTDAAESAGEVGGDAGVIVVAPDVPAAERVGLLAEGAGGVVDPDAHANRLVALARAEAEGGLDGPDVGGAETQPRLADFASRNERMKEFLELVHRVADSDATLLIGGPTGVGKERLARAIHAESARREGPFISLNCGALPENLLESELFGHAKGAFTGATEAREGRFEQANAGTIFLDEIGEMPPHLQVKLLTVLQRYTVQRLGDGEERPVDVRVMAATNRDLAEDVHAGRFREDLFFRLNVVTLTLPALEQRPEDIADLAGNIIRHFRTDRGLTQVRGIAPEAIEALRAHRWPGNVRELANVIERAMLLCRGEEIGLADLPPHIVRGEEDARAPDDLGGYEAYLDLPLSEARRKVADAFEREYLIALLKKHGGAVGETARAARINPRTLYEKMRRHGLSKEEFRP